MNLRKQLYTQIINTKKAAKNHLICLEEMTIGQEKQLRYIYNLFFD